VELAIDTSTNTAGVALARRGSLVAEATWRTEFRHTAELVATIEWLLGRAGGRPSALEAVAVAVGPGSFSGLRVGLSAAKGLAMSLGIPIVGVGTLAVEAYPFLGGRMPVCPLLDAGRGEIAAALFRETGGQPQEAQAPHLTTVERLCRTISEPTLFCGEHLPVVREDIVGRLGPLAAFPPASAMVRRPGHLAELGWRRLAHGDADDLAALQPVYLRAPAITEPRKP